jgi:hypothetical protein
MVVRCSGAETARRAPAHEFAAKGLSATKSACADCCPRPVARGERLGSSPPIPSSYGAMGNGGARSRQLRALRLPYLARAGGLRGAAPSTTTVVRTYRRDWVRRIVARSGGDSGCAAPASTGRGATATTPAAHAWTDRAVAGRSRAGAAPLGPSAWPGRLFPPDPAGCRRSASQAWASIVSVIWRYQLAQVRTS